MYKLALVLVGLLVFASCSNNGSNEKEKAEVTEINTELETVNEMVNSKEENGKVVYLTSETFKQKVFNYEVNQEWKYEGTIPCIVDFYADWCGPCKQIAPILDELAKEYDGKIIIYKVDTDKQRELASAFGIQSLPSILFVPIEGQPQMSKGALPKDSFVKAIEEVLLKQNTNEQS